MKKKILLIITIVLLCAVSAVIALASSGDNTYKVVDLLHNKTINSKEYYIVELDKDGDTTETFKLNFEKVKRGDLFSPVGFTEKTPLYKMENQLRWVVENSVLNGNMSLKDLEKAINTIAKKEKDVPEVKNLSMKDAVAGTQAALCEYIQGASKSTDQCSSNCNKNYYAVYKYYQYKLNNGASSKLQLPSKPNASIKFAADTSKDIVSKTISSITYRVLPYTLKSTNTPVLTLTNAPKGSYIDDITSKSFNVYVPVSALPDATFASITVEGSTTATTPYTDIALYLPQTKCPAMLLGQLQFLLENKAAHKDTHKWALPALFDYTLTVIGKQSGDPVKNLDFTFTNNCDISITKTTDTAGKIVLNDVLCGEFFFTIDKQSAIDAFLDVSADDYGLFTTTTGISMNVTRQGSYELTLEISEMPASITFFKYCSQSEKPLPFAVFGLFEQGKNKAFIQATSNENGMVVFNDLFPGNSSKYTIKETTNPVGYKGSFSDAVKLTRGQSLCFGDINSKQAQAILQTVTIDEQKCPGGILFNTPTKVDITAYVKDSINSSPLEGTRVEVYKGDYTSQDIPSSETPLVYGDTDSNGKIVFSDLKFTPAKEYTVVHTITLAGYDIDTTKHLLDLASIQLSTEVTFLDTPQKGKINVVIDTTKATDYYDDYEFLLIGAPEYPGQQQLTVGSITNLTTTYSSLLPGTYKLNQVVAPADYTEAGTIDLGITVTLPPGGEKTITLKDTDLCQDGFISVTKTDDASKPLKGAVFELYKGAPTEIAGLDKTQLAARLLATGTTDDTGVIVFGQFKPGSYTVIEKSAPSGYTLGTTTIFDASFADGNVTIGPVKNPKVSTTPSPTATPKPTATLPPGEVATGESSWLYVTAGILLVIGIAGFVFRKKIGELLSRV